MTGKTQHNPLQRFLAREDGSRRLYGMLAAYLLLYILCLVTYHGISDNWLFNDDFSWLREARYEMKPENLLTYRVVNFFRPLVNISFYSMERISPGNIPLHHSFNLILHFLNTILVFHLASGLLHNRWTGTAAAAIFAVSSIHTGAVLWISARTTLLSTFFLLASLIFLISRTRRRWPAIILSTLLYILALSAKETAIAGLPLVLLIFLVTRGKEHGHSMNPAALVSFTAVSVIYLIVRKIVMGGFILANWGPGVHILRNIAGGFLYQFYPFPLFSLFLPSATYIPEPEHPFLPELLALPLVFLLLWIGKNTGKSAPFTLATGWALLALLPASPFRHRFFSTVSITQNRYYYLASVGSVILVALLLSLLWNSKSRPRRIAGGAIFVLLLAGYIARVDKIEKKWDHFTKMYKETVSVLVEVAEKYPETTTLAVEDPPLAFPYMEDALVLEHPEWKVVEVHGGREKASVWKPCLYVLYRGQEPKTMRLEKLE